MSYSNAIVQCADPYLNYQSEWHFYRETNGATSECRYPFK